MGFFKALSRPHIALLWVSQVLSAMGDYFYTIAVVWMAVKTVGSNAGLVVAAEAISQLTFGLLGGVYADRWDRRKVMVTVDIIRAAAVAALPLLFYMGALQFWHFIVVAIIIGGLGSLFDPALQSSIPVLAKDKESLQATNGLMDVTWRLATTLGPSLAGLLVALIPLPQFFTLDSASFVISALAILSLTRHFVKAPDSEPVQPTQAGIGGIVKDIKSAIHAVYKHQLLGWIIITAGIINFMWSLCFTLGVPLFVDRVLHSGVGSYGLIIGAYGVGNVLSNIIIGSIRIRRYAPMIFCGNIMLGLGFLVMASSHTLLLAMFGTALSAIGGPMEDIPISTMIQTNLPSNQLGKVYSLRMIQSSVGVSLGYLIAIPLFNLLGVVITIVIAASILVLVGLAGLIRFRFTDPPTVTVA
jgi:MFS transporter, DHA3 family, macrolide efflux protein